MAILRASKLFIVIVLLIKISPSEEQQQHANSEHHSGRLLRKRSHEKDYAPRLSHQPASVQVPPRSPHTVECPVEAQPEGEVKWFKDGRPLAGEPGHLEQLASELMFVQTRDDDTGDYACSAANYLGSVTSEPFRLTVQSTVYDENILLAPHTHTAWDRQLEPVEFRCTLPKGLRWASSGNDPNGGGGGDDDDAPGARTIERLTWRRNGRPLPVNWTSGAPANVELAAASRARERADSGRFWARQAVGAHGELAVVLAILAPIVRELDDNSSFSCAYSLRGAPEGELARESRAGLLRVEPAPKQPVKLNIPMGEPALEPASGDLAASGAGTPRAPANLRSSLAETLADLADQIGKPSLLALGCLCLVSLLVALQLVLVRRRAHRHSHRYLKHHRHLGHLDHLGHLHESQQQQQQHLYFSHHQQQHHHHHNHLQTSSSSSGGDQHSGSGTSSGASSALDCGARGEDPVLSSLLARTLSAPAASSLGANATKKYKYYRGKVAAAISPTSAAALASSLSIDKQLESEFRASAHLTRKRRAELAKRLALTETQLKVWFMNRLMLAKEQEQELETHRAREVHDCTMRAFMDEQQAARDEQLAGDYLDAASYFVAGRGQQQVARNQQGLVSLAAVSSGAPEPLAPPNLYSQGVAAREQARNLLCGEHMRSLECLPSGAQLARQGLALERQHLALVASATGRPGRPRASAHATQASGAAAAADQPLTMNFAHRNSPAFSFAEQFDAKTCGPLEAGASSLLHQQQFVWQASQQQQSQLMPQTGTEHYQLVSCSSVSPSSGSSVVAASQSSGAVNNNNNSTCLAFASHQEPQESHSGQTTTSFERPPAPRDSVTSNHYSIIGANEADEEEEEEAAERDYLAEPAEHEPKHQLEQDEDEARYEELDERQVADAHFRRASGGRGPLKQQQQQQLQLQLQRSSGQPARASLISTRSSNSSNAHTLNESLGSAGGSRAPGPRRASGRNQSRTCQSQSQDQLSPYAVSSICHAPLNRQQQQQQQPPQQQAPPPVSSEAMRALNEQFDLNQLMLVDEASENNNENNSGMNCDGGGGGQQDDAAPRLPFSLPPPPPPSGSGDGPHARTGERTRRG